MKRKVTLLFLFVLFLFGSLNAMFSPPPEKTGVSEGFREVHLFPTIDIAFKKVFGEEKNKPVLIHFLNSILGRATDPIVDLRFANTEISPETLSDKLSRLDVLVQTSKKEIINIEIQVKDAGNMVDRSLFYASKLIATSLSSGQSYDRNCPIRIEDVY
jgi:predicted transposase/invertase (TIGR01784 family)